VELRHLRYFAAVAEDLSFRRAAGRLHVSHPSLSQQISGLEDELSLKLLKRNSRRVELTEAGRVFLAGARQTLSSAQRAVTQAQEVAKGERGRLVIGNLGSLTHTFLPAALAAFRERFPLVEVTVMHMNSHTQAEALLDGSIMLGIGYLDAGVDEEDRQSLATQLLLQCPYGIVYSKHRRFPKRDAPALSDFRNDTFLVFVPQVSPVHAHWTRELCRETGGFEPSIEAIANTCEDMISMVSAGRGVWVSTGNCRSRPSRCRELQAAGGNRTKLRTVCNMEETGGITGNGTTLHESLERVCEFGTSSTTRTESATRIVPAGDSRKKLVPKITLLPQSAVF